MVSFSRPFHVWTRICLSTAKELPAATLSDPKGLPETWLASMCQAACMFELKKPWIMPIASAYIFVAYAKTVLSVWEHMPALKP